MARFTIDRSPIEKALHTGVNSLNFLGIFAPILAQSLQPNIHAVSPAEITQALSRIGQQAIVLDFQENQDHRKPFISGSQTTFEAQGQVDDTEGGLTKIGTFTVAPADGHDVANVRSGPSTEAGIIGSQQRGDVLDVYDSESGWYKVQLDDGSFGWMFGGVGSFEEMDAPVVVEDSVTSQRTPEENENNDIQVVELLTLDSVPTLDQLMNLSGIGLTEVTEYAERSFGEGEFVGIHPDVFSYVYRTVDGTEYLYTPGLGNAAPQGDREQYIRSMIENGFTRIAGELNYSDSNGSIRVILVTPSNFSYLGESSEVVFPEEMQDYAAQQVFLGQAMEKYPNIGNSVYVWSPVASLSNFDSSFANGSLSVFEARYHAAGGTTMPTQYGPKVRLVRTSANEARDASDTPWGRRINYEFGLTYAFFFDIITSAYPNHGTNEVRGFLNGSTGPYWTLMNNGFFVRGDEEGTFGFIEVRKKTS